MVRGIHAPPTPHPEDSIIAKESNKEGRKGAGPKGVCMRKVCIQITRDTQAAQSCETLAYQIMQNILTLSKLNNQRHNWGWIHFDAFISIWLLSLWISAAISIKSFSKRTWETRIHHQGRTQSEYTAALCFCQWMRNSRSTVRWCLLIYWLKTCTSLFHSGQGGYVEKVIKK